MIPTSIPTFYQMEVSISLKTEISLQKRIPTSNNIEFWKYKWLSKWDLKVRIIDKQKGANLCYGLFPDKN